jgi:hypothetical protein
MSTSNRTRAKYWRWKKDETRWRVMSRPQKLQDGVRRAPGDIDEEVAEVVQKSPVRLRVGNHEEEVVDRIISTPEQPPSRLRLDVIEPSLELNCSPLPGSGEPASTRL